MASLWGWLSGVTAGWMKFIKASPEPVGQMRIERYFRPGVGVVKHFRTVNVKI